MLTAANVYLYMFLVGVLFTAANFTFNSIAHLIGGSAGDGAGGSDSHGDGGGGHAGDGDAGGAHFDGGGGHVGDGGAHFDGGGGHAGDGGAHFDGGGGAHIGDSGAHFDAGGAHFDAGGAHFDVGDAGGAHFDAGGAHFDAGGAHFDVGDAGGAHFGDSGAHFDAGGAHFDGGTIHGDGGAHFSGGAAHGDAGGGVDVHMSGAGNSVGMDGAGAPHTIADGMGLDIRRGDLPTQARPAKRRSAARVALRTAMAVLPLRPTALISFCAVTGGVGSIALRLGLPNPITHAVAGSSGYAISMLLGVALPNRLRRAQNTSAAERRELIGIKAKVVSSIAADGFGRITYLARGNLHSAPARHIEGKAVPQGRDVAIFEIRGHVFYVFEPEIGIDDGGAGGAGDAKDGGAGGAGDA